MNSMENVIIPALWLGAGICIFALMRTFTLWYFRLDDIADQQAAILSTLTDIAMRVGEIADESKTQTDIMAEMLRQQAAVSAGMPQQDGRVQL